MFLFYQKAVATNNPAIVQILLENGADINIKNKANKRPEDYVAEGDRSLRNILLGSVAITKIIKIPNEKHGIIIGKKGVTLKGIRSKSGTEIDIPKPEAQKDEITIKGREEDVKLAEELILNALERDSKRTGFEEDLPDGSISTALDVDPSNYKYIIGRKGATIQRITEETGAMIYVPSNSSPASQLSSNGPSKVIVRGTEEAVDKAIQRIFNAINRKGQEADGDQERERGGRNRGKGRSRGAQ